MRVGVQPLQPLQIGTPSQRLATQQVPLQVPLIPGFPGLSFPVYRLTPEFWATSIWVLLFIMFLLIPIVVIWYLFFRKKQ